MSVSDTLTEVARKEKGYTHRTAHAETVRRGLGLGFFFFLHVCVFFVIIKKCDAQLY